ncbi:MAG TPA: DUF3455 domain-containing protein, partial [Polyangiaceae bacterium]|nr:DUF3455 domain-containing protein [Polyangiaceae bacterium]
DSTNAPPAAPAPASQGSAAPAPASQGSAASAPASQGAAAPAASTDFWKFQGTQPVVLKALAKGAQVYVCKAKEGAAGTYEWTLKAPDAELFDEKGQKIGKHYAGPTWESTDGSKVVGQLRAKVDSPEPTAIPWLLLDAKTTEGTGVLSKVKNIQRLATVGGKAPATGCDAAHEKAETRVDYTATYYMYGP